MMSDAFSPDGWKVRAIDRARVWLGVVILVARAARRCFFGVLAVVVSLAFYMLAPQGKEILSLVVEDAGWSQFWFVWLTLSAAALTLIVWYSSRVLMSFHDLVDLKLSTPELQAFGARLETWFPRVLGSLCILPLAFFLADVGVKTYVLNSPLLIVAAFATLAAIDSLQNCLRCRLYRWGFLLGVVFVVLSHRWAAEVPYPEKLTLANLSLALFQIDQKPSFATTGFQLAIALAAWMTLDYCCARWARLNPGSVLLKKDRKKTLVLLSSVAVASIAAWLITFWTALLPRTSYVVPSTLIVAILVIAFSVHRRDWFPKMFSETAVTTMPSDRTKSAAGTRTAPQVQIATNTTMLLWAASILGAAIFLLIWYKPIDVGRLFGAPALLMLALGIWVVFGGVVLTILPNAYRLPSLGLLPLIAAGFNAIGGAPIAVSNSESPPANAGFTRPDVRASFKAWLARQDLPKDEPIYLVAAAGGGIRAAFLTASYLAAADDHSNGKFSKHVFAISGVSGGSLGAAMYALVGDGASRTSCAETDKQAANVGPRQRAMLCALGGDFLSPTVATYLFPDLFRALWVPAIFYRDQQWQDRGRTLEQAWVASVDPATASTLNARFLDYAAGANSRVGDGAGNVNLILNATRVQSGQRIVASTFTWPWLSTIDFFDPIYDTAATSMIGAVHNSARFTYVSPAGAYFYAGSRQGEFAGQVADGGYFDNSGVLSLLEVLVEIEKDNDRELLRRMHVVIITNDGHERRICDDSAPSAEASEVQSTAPIVTFLATRPARAELSKAQLRRVLARLNDVVDVCNAQGEPTGPLVEVSLNDDLVAKFLRREAANGINTGKCDESTMSAVTTAETGNRPVQSEKEIAVRIAEAPLGWTLAAATTDWLTRYASLEACKVNAQLSRAAP